MLSFSLERELIRTNSEIRTAKGYGQDKNGDGQDLRQCSPNSFQSIINMMCHIIIIN
ncbi:hypothetical protein AMI01nite_45060 [Aneurinibacillus migulanus]|nr:hypothetical protein AMI01nite_45060 [Aneurinibacillus migulanus]